MQEKSSLDRGILPPGQQLGSGAFGRVVKASVTGLDGPGATTVAVKMLKVHMDLSKLEALTKYIYKKDTLIMVLN